MKRGVQCSRKNLQISTSSKLQRGALWSDGMKRSISSLRYSSDSSSEITIDELTASFEAMSVQAATRVLNSGRVLDMKSATWEKLGPDIVLMWYDSAFAGKARITTLRKEDLESEYLRSSRM
jgi:hypothetical protein